MEFRDTFTGRKKTVSVWQGVPGQEYVVVEVSSRHDRVPTGASFQWFEPDAVDPDPMPDDGNEYAACDHALHQKRGSRWVLVTGMVGDASKRRGYKTTCKLCEAEAKRLRRMKWRG